MKDKEINITSIVNKLIQLTRSGELKWDRDPFPSSSVLIDGDDMVNIVYVAEYKNRFLRLFERKYKDFDSDEETFTWTSTVILELIDRNCVREWIFPFKNTMWDLLEAVQYQTADVKGFLENFMNNE